MYPHFWYNPMHQANMNNQYHVPVPMQQQYMPRPINPPVHQPFQPSYIQPNTNNHHPSFKDIVKMQKGPKQQQYGQPMNNKINIKDKNIRNNFKNKVNIKNKNKNNFRNKNNIKNINNVKNINNKIKNNKTNNNNNNNKQPKQHVKGCTGELIKDTNGIINEIKGQMVKEFIKNKHLVNSLDIERPEIAQCIYSVLNTFQKNIKQSCATALNDIFKCAHLTLKQNDEIMKNNNINNNDNNDNNDDNKVENNVINNTKNDIEIMDDKSEK